MKNLKDKKYTFEGKTYKVTDQTLLVVALQADDGEFILGLSAVNKDGKQIINLLPPMPDFAIEVEE